MATFLQTQRRRLRDHLKQQWAETGIKTLIDGTGFCSTCRRISARLEKVIDRGFDGLDMLERECLRVRIDLRNHIPVEQSRQKKCNLCNVMAHMLRVSGTLESWLTENCYLYIGSAKNQYGILEDFDISDTFCMWVQSVKPQMNEVEWFQLMGLLKFVPRIPYHRTRDSGLAGIALEVSSDPGKIGGRLVGPYADFELVKSWFDDCTLHHGSTTCQTDASILQEIPGLQVIDCSSRRLVSWSQLPKNQDRNYVALSYVWGTKSDDENDGNKDISDRTVDWPLPSKLPPLIEDTITAVIKLGLKYLWIDRYCIPQGDQEAKHTQIQNMDSIYGSASLTIIAAASDDPSHGLPGVSLPRYGRGRPDKNPPVSVRIGSRTFVTVDTSTAPSVLRDSMWNNRAWTMQEAFLSCRCLVFFDDGAYFQCSSPRSHRFEALHEPSALLQLRHEVLSTQNTKFTRFMPAKSLILTKIGEAEVSELDWCVQLVEDYFPRSLTFENDTLNAFSGMLKYLQSLKPSIYNLWGVLMLPEVISMSSGQRIRYNLVRTLAWCYLYRQTNYDPILRKLDKLEGTTASPRKEMFPSWTWADWRPRVELHGGGGDDDKYTINYHPEPPRRDLIFTSLVDLSVELDDGRVVSWAQGYLYDSDVSWLTTLPNPPRILHIQGYTANPQLRYMTEVDWAKFHERTILPINETYAHSGSYDRRDNHCCGWGYSHRWILIDADGQHLQSLLEPTNRTEPRCWANVEHSILHSDNLSAVAYLYHFQTQRGNQADSIKPYTECTFDFRVIVLGYNQSGHIYYMMLMKSPGLDNQTETFARVNVMREDTTDLRHEEPAEVKLEGFLDWLTGKLVEPCRGTPWVKMNTRIA
ncbi:heterokaryon incompatibility protein-domain-containing protein [Neurospora hispaniola]|uniref:Heterokaryon incompatibility protein-domain-containing protein n=1 Tax=Neurospora hispaniola TaxID=588809 RepID=A0AAJ0HYB1_9PEZI|nr:heterokaryon incompatibility protein-domain-containing protein [Neurospora hispaniola]